MIITKVGWTKYRVAFTRPFETAHGLLLFREGLLVKMVAPGFEGWGEIAPLPDFGEGGTVMDALALLQKIVPALAGLEVEQLLAGTLDALIEQASQELSALSPDLKITGQVQSTLRFGLELAAYDILARACNLPLAEYWGVTLAPLEVNATIGTPDLAETVGATRHLVEAGYKCIKLKVGITANETAEIARVAAVRQVLDSFSQPLRLRLDANEAWTVPQAIRLLKQMVCCNLELVEQPVAGVNIAGLAQVRHATGLTIAADESVVSVEAAREIIAAQAAQVLVIKPSLVGGVQAARAIIKLVEAAGLRGLVTTALDTGVGIAGAFQLALTLRRPPLACGLATAQLLTDTLVTNLPQIQNGWMLPLSAPGLGIEVV